MQLFYLQMYYLLLLLILRGIKYLKILFKFDEGRYDYTGYSEPNEIVKFILTTQSALVSEINEDVI